MEPQDLFDQRYYHIIVLSPGETTTSTHMWQALEGIQPGRQEPVEDSWGKITYRSAVIDTGHGMSILPGPPDGGERIQVDLFAFDIRTGENTFLALAVPYLRLGRNITLQLRDRGFLRNTQFMKPALQQVVDGIRSKDSRFGDLHVRKVALRLDGDPDLSALAFSGENIIFSHIYSKVTAQLSEGTVTKVHLHHSSIEGVGMRLHCDAFGNFKAFIRKDFSNVHLLANFIDIFDSAAVVSFDASIPFFRGSEVDDEEAVG